MIIKFQDFQVSTFIFQIDQWKNVLPIWGFSCDIYNQNLKICPLKRIYHQKKYDNI